MYFLGLLIAALFVLAVIGAVVLLVKKLIIPGVSNLMTDPAAPRTESNAPTPPRLRNPGRLADSLTVRSIVIGILALLMLIPLAMVGGTVAERHQLYRSVLQDIASLWGSRQVLQGPVLVVPYVEKHLIRETVKDEKTGKQTTTSKVVFHHQSAVALPRDLELQVDLEEQVRHRGIYDALVYTADVRFQGHLERPDVAALSESLYRVDWDKAYLVISLSDTRAINEVSELLWNTQPRSLSPGTRLTDLLGNGFHAPLDLSAESEAGYDFDLRLSINGSQGLRFTPFGENTEVTMISSWPHPSFQGSTLPTSYETHAEGFEARWSIPHLARNYPQLFAYPERSFQLDEFLAGVDLFEPVFLYSKVTRAVKYGLLFVGLTFLVLLIFELVYAERLHFVQYGLIGIALSLFYLTLLSLAEHVSFLRAYLLASSINIGMITLYTGAALASWPRAGIILVSLSTLYTLLFSLLHMEDYALLMGTALLLIVVAVLMVLTRNLRGRD